VISVGALTPILFAFTSWRLRHLQISTTPATPPNVHALITPASESALSLFSFSGKQPDNGSLSTVIHLPFYLTLLHWRKNRPKRGG
jgi:hypothetical protein